MSTTGNLLLENQNLQKFLESCGVHLYLERTMAARNKDHRIVIRKKLVTELEKMLDLGALTDEEKKQLLDVNLRPHLIKAFYSISHAMDLGGFVISLSPVGLDIEDGGRLSKAIIQRVALPEEIKLIEDNLLKSTSGLDYKYLWVAKEALFKMQSDLDFFQTSESDGKNQGQNQRFAGKKTTISQHIIVSWKPLKGLGYLFKSEQGYKGFIFKYDQLLIAIASNNICESYYEDAP